jgi:NADH:ubiquinone oxidoreductase subunit 5 (subunit L)/multisubunit Na+/H+ antiporter MnhA subunit
MIFALLFSVLLLFFLVHLFVLIVNHQNQQKQKDIHTHKAEQTINIVLLMLILTAFFISLSICTSIKNNFQKRSGNVPNVITL